VFDLDDISAEVAEDRGGQRPSEQGGGIKYAKSSQRELAV
jgi:hypothetical protein